MKKINTNTRRNIKRNITNNSTIIILNVSKGRLILEKPNPVNDGLDNKARGCRSLSGNIRPAKEKDNRRGTGKLPTKDLG